MGDSDGPQSRGILSPDEFHRQRGEGSFSLGLGALFDGLEDLTDAELMSGILISGDDCPDSAVCEEADPDTFTLSLAPTTALRSSTALEYVDLPPVCGWLLPPEEVEGESVVDELVAAYTPRRVRQARLKDQPIPPSPKVPQVRGGTGGRKGWASK